MLSIFEDSVSPVFRIKTTNWTGAVITSDDITVQTIRTDNNNNNNNEQLFKFAPKDTFLQSVDEIPEPHEFKAVVVVKSLSKEFIEHEHHHDHKEHHHKEHEHHHQKEQHDHKEHDHKEHHHDEHHHQKEHHNDHIIR